MIRRSGDQKIRRGRKRSSTPVEVWFASQGWTSQAFQREVWSEMLAGKSGLLNAPTGTGKTYAVWGGVVNAALRTTGSSRRRGKQIGATPGQARSDNTKGLRAIWITPLRALANEIAESAQRMCDGVGLGWTVGTRTGDTSTKERAAQKKLLPHLLVTTPESLHVMLSQKGTADLFKQLDWFIADEWHELLGSKRGVQVELALSRLKGLRPGLGIWGISATIGNIEEAMEVLQGSVGGEGGGVKYDLDGQRPVLVRSNVQKPIEMHTILPDKVEHYPWAGHLGLKLSKKLLPIIEKSTSTLIFTNTRGQAEIWYHHLLDSAPELAGVMALHHGSLDRNLREWVEQALDEGRLKAVVCTSSLDLGVDFRPVETVVQIGGPKGVARFAQRAGRSGHRPDAIPRIWFLPTHALELVEAAALREAVNGGIVEARQPMVRSFDVLVQYLVTLAVGDGFDPKRLFDEVRSTFCFSTITPEEWDWALTFITTGGKSLLAYDEFQKCVVDEDGLVRVVDRRIALRHRLSIGTIVGEAALAVKFISGGHIGTIEEYFINQLRPGDVFWFAGRSLEFVRVKDLTAYVVKSKATKGKIPSWQGGRMPLSSYMAKVLREQFNLTPQPPLPRRGGEMTLTPQTSPPAPLRRSGGGMPPSENPEMKAVQPLLDRQREHSIVPSEDELLIERFESKEGHHVVVYPFEGRLVHEALASLLAFRMSLLKPMTFSIAMNDYGFELLSDEPIPIQEAIDNDFFSETDLLDDLQRSLNATELAKRKFRDIASIAGLVFKGMPGRPVKERHMRGNSSLFFEVFSDHEPGHLLLRQAYDEAFNLQLELPRLHAVLQRIARMRIVLKEPGNFTPFAFPIIVDRLREKLTSEQLEDRIRKMTERLEKQ
ncbi:MAG: ligase-associated DNA damage response DEXH box helicase [Flavobacteriales bacterium]|nr:ligase-associated DNA damage response DEXH box helicase [Flavobacteriales bacterium]